MGIELRLTPGGKLLIQGDLAEDTSPALKRIRDSFADGTAQGLVALAALDIVPEGSLSIRFWRDFASSYLTALCLNPETAGASIEVAPLSKSESAGFLLCAPPTAGAEYLSVEILERLWRDLDSHAMAEIKAAPAGLAGFLLDKVPRFRQVGRVCFHLAENRRDPELPFAFLATYASGLNAAGKPRHLPLSRALQESAEAGDRKALVKLLSPVSAAAEKSILVRELLESGDIYHPVAWDPEQAWRFLSETRVCEESGIVVRLPDWWKKRPRPQVRVTIGDSGKSKLGIDAVLDFNVQVVLGGETLSRDELNRILEAGGGLVLFKGQWIEADRDRIAEALDHWKKVAAAAEDGISFIEGMRLLAGAETDLSASSPDRESMREWAFVEAGEWLGLVLEGLRSPESLEAVKPGKELLAKLRPYQQEGLNWLWFMAKLGLGACLADDMGLGKTVQVLALLLALKKTGPDAPDRKPALIVLPASLLSNWKAEIARFAPSLSARFIHPSESPASETAKIEAAVRNHRAASGVDVVVTTYGMLSRLEWLLDADWGLAVLDEAQAIKNPGTIQARSARKIKAGARIALTGTPVENRLSDLWSIFDFLCPGLLGSAKRFKEFSKALEKRETQRYAPLKNLVGPYILRRMKTDRRIISDLPDKTEVRANCGLTKKQAALYAQLNQELASAMENADGIQRRGLILSHIMRLKQLCNHPSQLTGDGDYDPKESGKFVRIAGIAEEIASRGEKALVFTQFREITDGLAAHLESIFGRPGLVLHGGTPVGRRREMVDAFQSEEGPPFFVLSLKAGGTGLNLTAASHVVLFDRWWNPAVENQAMDRAFRIGQTKNVMVHKFVCNGTIEDKIDALLTDKSAMAGEILGSGVEKMLTEMSDAELIDFVSLDIDRARLHDDA